MDQLSEARKRIMEHFGGLDNIDEIISTLPTEIGNMWNNGIKRQKEIEEELFPFLKEHNIEYSDPSTMAVMFIQISSCIIVSLKKEDEHIYDIELYTGKEIISSVPYKNTDLGYNPNKRLLLNDLKEELLKLKKHFN